MTRYRIMAENVLNPFARRPFQGFTLPRTLLATDLVQKKNASARVNGSGADRDTLPRAAIVGSD